MLSQDLLRPSLVFLHLVKAVCVCVCVHAKVGMWMPWDNLREVALPPPWVPRISFGCGTWRQMPFPTEPSVLVNSLVQLGFKPRMEPNFVRV